MNINDILTEIEYTKERSAKELFEWFTRKNEELRAWSWEHLEIKHRELSKDGLPKKFIHELTPFAYYANTYYDNKPGARFKPCCDTAKPYEGIVVNSGSEVFVEITEAIFGNEWAIQKEVLAETGRAPSEYSILGVTKKNRAVKKKQAIGLSGEIPEQVDCICELKKLVKKTAEKKCVESLKQSLKYGRNKTILIVTFDDIVVSPSTSKKDWDDFVDFKRTEIDSMKHNFGKIILFGYWGKRFID